MFVPRFVTAYEFERFAAERPIEVWETAEKSSSPWPSAIACWKIERAAAAVCRLNAFVCGIPQSIGQIFRHPVQREVGSEIVGCRSIGDSFYDSASGSAAGENGDGCGAIKSTRIDHGQRFGKRRGLYSADEVVDELHHSAATNRAQV